MVFLASYEATIHYWLYSASESIEQHGEPANPHQEVNQASASPPAIEMARVRRKWRTRR